MICLTEMDKVKFPFKFYQNYVNESFLLNTMTRKTTCFAEDIFERKKEISCGIASCLGIKILVENFVTWLMLEQAQVVRDHSSHVFLGDHTKTKYSSTKIKEACDQQLHSKVDELLNYHHMTNH